MEPTSPGRHCFKSLTRIILQHQFEDIIIVVPILQLRKLGLTNLLMVVLLVCGSRAGLRVDLFGDWKCLLEEEHSPYLISLQVLFLLLLGMIFLLIKKKSKEENRFRGSISAGPFYQDFSLALSTYLSHMDLSFTWIPKAYL